MRIPGVPGAPEPLFRTHRRELLPLDLLVLEVCGRLKQDGLLVSPRVAKASIQCARGRLLHADWPDVELLALQVSRDLRQHRVILVPSMIEVVLVNYVRLLMDLDITEVV